MGKINILSNNSPLLDIQQSYIQSQILLDKIPDNILEINKNESKFGDLFLDNSSFVYSRYNDQFLKIFGNVNEQLIGPAHVNVSIKTPDGNVQISEIILSGTKYFETLYKIDRESLIGKYEISVEYSGEISNIKNFKIIEFEEKSYPKSMETKSISNEIPSWIKNNAGWWADGTIDDDSFVQGIQFLVNEEIISVDSISQNNVESKEIPTWIKNNAGWWADGAIDDSTFITGIEFLVKEGMIQVD